MTLFLTALAAAASLAAAEPAPTGAAVDATYTSPAAAKPLVVCDRDDASKRSLKRQYGGSDYVTADEVMASLGDGQRWDAPRCITAAELSRLERKSGQTFSVAGR